jgi:hypothetical protein
MYQNHNLRTQLQEWKNRLSKAKFEQFGNNLMYFFNNVRSDKLLSGLMTEAIRKYPFSYEEYKEKEDEVDRGNFTQIFENEMHHAAFMYQLALYMQQDMGNYNLHMQYMFQQGKFEDTKESVIQELISPILYYLHDALDRSSSTLYLLEKYKRRTEWFTYATLIAAYQGEDKNYEEIFDHDLRMFLFDQGIDYPFSTPRSASGRADIVGAIDTDDPIIIEVKVFDRQKNYSKNRVKDGFTQAIKYTHDYNKDIGYIVIFNMDKAELNFQFLGWKNTFPPAITFNHKTYFFVVINLWKEMSASKVGTTEAIDITEEELTN